MIEIRSQGRLGLRGRLPTLRGVCPPWSRRGASRTFEVAASARWGRCDSPSDRSVSVRHGVCFSDEGSTQFCAGRPRAKEFRSDAPRPQASRRAREAASQEPKHRHRRQGQRPPPEGSAHRTGAGGRAGGRGDLPRDRRSRPAHLPGLRHGEEGDPLRRRRHGNGTRGRAGCGTLQPGFSGRGRFARARSCAQDLRHHGSCPEERHAPRRNERLRRSTDSGGRRVALRIRPGLLPERRAVGRRATDLADPGQLRGRRGLQPGPQRLPHHDPQDRQHVHLRPRGHPRRHRRDGHHGADRVGRDQRLRLGQHPLRRRERRGCPADLPRAALVPAVQQPGGPAPRHLPPRERRRRPRDAGDRPELGQGGVRRP